jgi:hypothetical protein
VGDATAVPFPVKCYGEELGSDYDYKEDVDDGSDYY